MKTPCLLFALASILFAVDAAAQVDWKFSEETCQLFAPLNNATIEEMQTWANRLDHSIPDDTEKWGGFEKYRERVARLKIDIAQQIIASKPDDETLDSALAMLWFPHFILAKQDKANIPSFEKLYTELKQHSDAHGRKLDRFTNNLLISRTAVVRDLLKITEDEKYIAQGEELLAEYNRLLEGKPLGKNAEEFYSSKYGLLLDLQQYAPDNFDSGEFRKEMRKIFDTRENELETATFYRYCGPIEPFNTPEGQAEHRAWIERITQKIAAAEDALQRFGFHTVKVSTLRTLLDNDGATEAEYRAYAQELETRSVQERNTYYSHDIHIIYHHLFYREFQRLINGDTITDDALHHIFVSARHMLHAGDSAYGYAGDGLFTMTFVGEGDELFNRLTPEQQTYYIEAYIDLLAETEKVEKERIAAGKPMERETAMPTLRDHLARLQLLLLRTEITFLGTALDGKPFDLKSLRGKVVLLDFWGMGCRPCIDEFPDLKKHYEKYHARGFEIVGIDVTDDKERLVEFLKAQQLPWIQLHDPEGELHDQLHGFGVPYCLLLDREGRLVLQPARGEILQQKLAEMFSDSI
ncbi:MAG: TlpA family protein disulfide reductase [Planctomycetaceae bacterium]|jgi:thiol-disulfide isomerase/thioredoxin|nr:TlpA family protein disulfide reductase [Planctomycetaceae bacterium]